MYSSTSVTMPLEHRISSLSIHSASTASSYGRAKYEPYGIGSIYAQQPRRRLSSTGEGSGDTSTTASGSGGSSYGEKDSDGSEGRADHVEEEDEEVQEEEEEEEEEVVAEDVRRRAGAESPMDGIVTELEKQQIEHAYRGLKTQVYVGGCLANLYTKTSTEKEWTIRFTGIPVVIHDDGGARARTKRRIQIVLAERGTCFMLWRDTIDHLTAYSVSPSAASFHTMHYSADHSVQIGFSFDADDAAHDVWRHIERLVADPENISLSTPGKKQKAKQKKRKERKSGKPAPLPPKTQISLPCCFQHITNVEHADRGKYYSLKEYVPRTAYNPAQLRASREEL